MIHIKEGISNPGWLLLAWLSRQALDLTASVAPLPNVTDVAAAVSAAGPISECPTIQTLDVEWNCKTAINIFTDGVDDQLVIAALLDKATKTMKEHNCDEYPIKFIFGDGGYNSPLWRQTLINQIYELGHAGIAPGGDWFFGPTHVLAGPTARDYNDSRYDAVGRVYENGIKMIYPEYPFAALGMKEKEKPLDTLMATYSHTMSALSKQEDPIYVALRPIHEFAVWWTESSLYAGSDVFNITARYQQLKSRIDARGADIYQQGSPRQWRATEGVNFGKARVIMYQGDSNFAGMGEFFKDEIMDSTNASETAAMVEELERAFVTTPKQFVLVDRSSLLSHFKTPTPFTAATQSQVYRKIQAKMSGTYYFEKFLGLVSAWNRAAIAEKTADVYDILDDHPMTKVWNDRAEHGKRHFEKLQVRAAALSIIEVELGKEDSTLDQAAFRRTLDIWKDRTMQWGRDRLDSYQAVGQGNLNTTEVLHSWVSIALAAKSYIPVSSLLVPFCLGLGGSLVRDSLEQVVYGGRNTDVYNDDADWRGTGISGVGYNWPKSNSCSTVWFSKAPAGLSTNDVAARDTQLKVELGELYEEVFSP
ncbi:MAG: hypothetical protein M1838_000544 [Thelocarpon superellum]|nr:MAG: hypothetical protein M1838_000544 [Thelocarpon superellum]